MSKLPIFQWFADRGDVLISVNTLTEGVDIPTHLKSQEIVDFILGVNPTPKMTAGQEGIKASMRFAGKVYTCRFPWDSIIQMSGHDAVIQFRSSQPQTQGREPGQNSGAKKRQKPKKRPNLRIVK
ncbi:MAG: hypothetical protein ACNS63_13085 [Candidatus Nitrospinota bacterium M3_3B_026]